jgi:transcriptional regulator with XRE-family HTH domain
MPRRAGTIVTPQVITQIKNYLTDPKYSALCFQEIAALAGVSQATVSRIKNGDYDYLLDQQVVTAKIEYEELKHLFACEQIVKDLLAASKLSDTAEDELYFPRHIAHATLQKYVPDMVQERLEYLSTIAN